MKVARHILATTLAQQSLGSYNAKQFAQRIAAYLISERRTSQLNSLTRDISQYRADHGIVEVVAVVARNLDDTARHGVEREVKTLYPLAKQIIITELIDPKVVGGVRLEFPNQQLDLSVRGKLNHLKQLTATRS